MLMREELNKNIRYHLTLCISFAVLTLLKNIFSSNKFVVRFRPKCFRRFARHYFVQVDHYYLSFSGSPARLKNCNRKSQICVLFHQTRIEFRNLPNLESECSRVFCNILIGFSSRTILFAVCSV